MGSEHGHRFPSITSASSPRSVAILVVLVAVLSYVSMVLGSGMSVPPHNVSPLWPTNAVVLIVLLAVPRRLWLILITTAYSVVGLLHVLAAPIAVSLWLTLGNVVEVVVAAFGVRYFFNSVPRLNNTKALAQYSLIAAVAAPFAGAFIGALATNQVNYWLHWRMWFLSDGLALFTLPPAVWGLVHLVSSLGRRSRLYYLELVTLTAVLILFGHATLVASGRSTSQAQLYLLSPLLLWFAFRFGCAGTSISVLILSVLSIWGAVHGRGPFTALGPIDSVLSLQLFLLFTAAPFMVLAVLVEQHKQIERALRESEERIHLAVQAGKMYAYEWDISTDKVVRSTECGDILGESEPTQITRSELMARIHPDDREQVAASFLKLTPHSPHSQISYRVLALDGRTIWVEKSARAFFDHDGRMLRMIGVIADITARKQAEETVRESERRYRRIVETTNEGVWLLDSKFHTVFVNRQLAEMLGYDPVEMVGRSVFDFYFPEDVDLKRQRLERRRQGLRENFDDRLRRRDGSELWVRLAAIPALKDSGEFDGALAMVSDITQRRRAEESLRESEERFRLVANTAPVMIWMSDTDKLCTYVNQPWLEFTGRPLEAQLGNGWAESLHPQDFSRSMDTYTQAFDRREHFQMEYRLRRHDGVYRWLSATGVPRFNPDHSFAGYIGSCTDITERKLAEESLADVGRKLIEAHEEERTWIARELHDDVNQRMALLAIELDRWNHQLPPSAVELHDHIQHASQRLSDIATDVQALSHRLHSSKLEYLGLVAAAKSFCKELSEQQKVEIDFSHTAIPRSMPKEISLCLFRVLQETLQNAVKHSGVRHIKVDLSGTEGEIQLTVSDLGVGFDPQDAIHRRGLGLISMRERMQLVSGEISIKSQPGSGTTIHARVPFSSSSDSMRATG